MALKVMIPLHEDRTALHAKHQLATDANLAVECVSFALAKALDKTAKGAWPELKCIYIDCMLGARTARGGAARFEKKYGELVLDCAVNLKKICALPAPAQCRAVMQSCLAPLGEVLRRRKMPSLSVIASNFHANLTLEFVRKCLTQHAHRFAYLREDAAPPRQRKRKPAFRRRVVNALPAKKGELWLMFRTGDRHDADAAGNVTASVRALATRRKLGRYTGASMGDASADISFAVARQSAAAQAIAEFLDKEYPEIYFILSDDYEVVFDV